MYEALCRPQALSLIVGGFDNINSEKDEFTEATDDYIVVPSDQSDNLDWNYQNNHQTLTVICDHCAD